MEGIADLGDRQSRELFAESVHGGAFTPTCPACDEKMTVITPTGRKNFKSFWGCRNYRLHAKKTFENDQYPLGNGAEEVKIPLPS